MQREGLNRRWRHVIRVCAVMWCVACLGGCGEDFADSSLGPPASGQIGQVDLFPECGALSQACLQQGLNSPLAVGSALGLGINFNVTGNSGPPATLEAVNPAVIAVEEAVIEAKSQGAAAVMIVGPDGRVLDFIHIWTAEADELRLIRRNEDTVAIGVLRSEGQLLVGDDLLVSLEAFNGTQPLLGVFPVAWTVEVLEAEDGATPVVLVEDLIFGFTRLVAREPGRVRLTATALGLDKVLELEVLP